MCLDGDWTAAHWSADLAAQDLPMSTLTAGLTPSIEYRGRLSVTASASGEGAQPLTGTLRADLADAGLSHHTASGKVELIKLGTGVVTVNATHAAIATEVSFDAGEVGTINGRANIARTAARWQDMPLQGEVHAQTAELGYVTLYFPEIDKAAGRLDVNLAVAGTLGTPLIQGSIKLSNTELDFYQVNLSLRQTEFEANLHDNALDFTGSAHIGQGILSAKGALAWRDSLPYGDVYKRQVLRCSDAGCAQEAFPRIDPAIIVMVSDGARALLGRQASWPAGRYSTIAGFVEPGESLEDAVVREVAEETGVAVRGIQYHSSQPWPFPASLMVGFQARCAPDAAIRVGGELEDVRWFTRTEIDAGAAGLPPAHSICLLYTSRCV